MAKSLLTQLVLTFTWSASLGEASYSFITLGDWGGEALGSYHATAVNAVAKQMGETAAANSIKFVVNVGDNFYYCGIQNTSDPQIQEDYLSIYTAPGLQVPWYSALGNHEYGYNVDAQVQFTKVDKTKRWYLPDRYYTKRVELTAGQYLTFIVMDTNPCISAYRSSSQSGWDPCGSDFPTCSPIAEGACHFHANIMTQDCSTQYAWLKTQLANVNKEDWLVMVGHHPADEIDVEDFTSVFQQHGFDIYLNGHVHTLNQYTVDNKGAYVTSGAGAMVATADQDNDARCVNAEGSNVTNSGHTYQSVFNQKVAGFTLHTFSADFKELKTEFMSYTGEVVHSFSVKKGGSPSPSPSPGPPRRRAPAPTPSSCGGAGAYPCTSGCTYVHKANEGACGVSGYGCYDCANLPAGCPDCSSSPSPSADITV